MEPLSSFLLVYAFGLLVICIWLVLTGRLVPRRAMGQRIVDDRPLPSVYECVVRNHNVIPVESIVTGDLLAGLCLDCDRQLQLDDTEAVLGVRNYLRKSSDRRGKEESVRGLRRQMQEELSMAKPCKCKSNQYKHTCLELYGEVLKYHRGSAV